MPFFGAILWNRLTDPGNREALDKNKQFAEEIKEATEELAVVHAVLDTKCRRTRAAATWGRLSRDRMSLKAIERVGRSAGRCHRSF
jgi:hypothetical protein